MSTYKYHSYLTTFTKISSNLHVILSKSWLQQANARRYPMFVWNKQTKKATPIVVWNYNIFSSQHCNNEFIFFLKNCWLFKLINTISLTMFFYLFLNTFEFTQSFTIKTIDCQSKGLFIFHNISIIPCLFTHKNLRPCKTMYSFPM